MVDHNDLPVALEASGEIDSAGINRFHFRTGPTLNRDPFEPALGGVVFSQDSAFKRHGKFASGIGDGHEMLEKLRGDVLVGAVMVGEFERDRERFDTIVLDPPAFAKKTLDVDRACRGYKDVNRLALKLLAPGGVLLACSCSGPVSIDLFQKVLFAAALDAGVPARILERRGAGPDHPVSIDCPETEYLKAFLLAR